MTKPDWEELRRQLEISERKRAFLQKRLVLSSSEEDSTLWSYVDLLSLLLILFILFYSHAAIKNVSAKDTATEQLNSDLVAPPQSDKVSAELSQPVDKIPPGSDRDAEEEKQENKDESLKQLEKQLMQAVTAEDKDDLSIRWHQRRLVVTLGEKIMFNAGKANLLAEVEPTLKQIAALIAPQKDYRVSVAGHTDDAPINNYQFPSNWELSAARAVNVAKFLIANGVNPQRVSIEGYSAYRPLRANTSSQNRQSNRRVEITFFEDQSDMNSPPASLETQRSQSL